VVVVVLQLLCSCSIVIVSVVVAVKYHHLELHTSKVKSVSQRPLKAFLTGRRISRAQSVSVSLRALVVVIVIIVVVTIVDTRTSTPAPTPYATSPCTLGSVSLYVCLITSCCGRLTLTQAREGRHINYCVASSLLLL